MFEALFDVIYLIVVFVNTNISCSIFIEVLSKFKLQYRIGLVMNSNNNVNKGDIIIIFNCSEDLYFGKIVKNSGITNIISNVNNTIIIK